jgi:hypothetical protein
MAISLRVGRCPACGPSVFVRYANDETGVRCLRCRATPITLSLISVLLRHIPLIQLSTLHAYELSAPDVEVGIQGKGDAEVHATNRLRGSIVGMGNIRYTGHPKDVEKSITGIGDIEPR